MSGKTNLYMSAQDKLECGKLNTLVLITGSDPNSQKSYECPSGAEEGL